MPELESLPQEVKDQLAGIGTPDVVIGLTSLKSADDLTWAADAGKSGLNVLIAYPGGGDVIEFQPISGVRLLRYPVSAPERYFNAPASIFGSFLEVLQISQRLDSKACCVWNSGPQTSSAGIFAQMTQPVLEQKFDLVVANYIQAKWGALVNSSIICPLTRALYGRRIQFPMAVDLAFSSRMVARLIQSDPGSRLPRAQHWIATEAICGGMQICQAALPMEPPRPPESADLSSILAAVLSRIFSDLDRNASFWQRSAESQFVPIFGEFQIKEQDEVTVDVQQLIETFQLGYRNLTEIWGLALSPATLMELKKLVRVSPAEFRVADDLWVRVVFEFALAHRQRAINREHLLRAMTPLYLAWVASYTLQMQGPSAESFQNRLERLALTYENHKPYLLSRWRWPDRFNP
jgi:hypothetical protein